MDLDELKNKWQSVSIRSDVLKNDNRRMASKLAAGRAANAKDQLSTFYKRTAICGLCLPALAPMLVTVLDLPVWVSVLYALLGLVMSLLNYNLARDIDKNDIMSQPVVTAISYTIRLRKRQRRLKAIVGLDDDSIVWGMLIGLVVSLPIAYKRGRKAMALSKQMQNELRACLADEDTATG
mgnify:CR=1 FL=1